METKQNSGAIFRNDKKTNEKQPDYKGKVNVNGKEMEIALWLKESSKGIKYFSCSFSEPYVNESPKYVQPKDEGREALRQTIIRESNFDNDDLPF